MDSPYTCQGPILPDIFAGQGNRKSTSFVGSASYQKNDQRSWQVSHVSLRNQHDVRNRYTCYDINDYYLCIFVPGSKLLLFGMVIPPLTWNR